MKLQRQFWLCAALLAPAAGAATTATSVSKRCVHSGEVSGQRSRRVKG